jgi:hypothetical protein
MYKKIMIVFLKKGFFLTEKKYSMQKKKERLGLLSSSSSYKTIKIKINN